MPVLVHASCVVTTLPFRDGVGGGSPVVIADDYAWRTDWTGSTTINNVGIYDSLGSGGSIADTAGELINLVGSDASGQIKMSTAGAKPGLSSGARFKLN